MIEHVDRPWGAYTVLAEAEDFKVKTIEVQQSQRLSYQRHARRSEHWFVVGGEGVVTLDGSSIHVRRGDTVDVPVGCSVFPAELQRPSRRWAQKRFTDIRYWNEPARGGHFAAFEQPKIFTEELRKAFRSRRG